jgi:hypothetical protein
MHASCASHDDPVRTASAAAALGLKPSGVEPDLFGAAPHGALAQAIDDLRLDLSDEHYKMCSNEAKVEFTEAEIAGLHWELLREIKDLADPAVPLATKLDTLAWVLQDKPDAPFSFEQCVRVVSTHPSFEDFIQQREAYERRLAQANATGVTEATRHLPVTDYLGYCDPDTVRLYVQVHAVRWLRGSLERLPAEAQSFFRANPMAVCLKLQTNPQYLNEVVAAHRRRLQTKGPDLFDMCEGECA